MGEPEIRQPENREPEIRQPEFEETGSCGTRTGTGTGTKEKCRVCVAGVGAIGGLLAAVLGGLDTVELSVIARGGRAESIRRDGLRLHSVVYGERTVHPAHVEADGASLQVQDFVLVCVKNYSLDEIAAQLRPCVDSHTVVVPVMNGVEPGDRLRALFPDAVVCDSLIYTVTGANPDYSLTQLGDYTYLFIGSKDPDARHVEGARALHSILLESGFDSRWSDEIERAIWEKFVLNCAFNIVTARYVCHVADIRADEKKKADILSLLKEAYAVGTAEGIRMKPDLVEDRYEHMMTTQDPKGTSSMKRDVEAKRRTELDAFLGAVLRKAEKHGLEVPVTARYYRELSEIITAYGQTI